MYCCELLAFHRASALANMPYMIRDMAHKKRKGFEITPCVNDSEDDCRAWKLLLDRLQYISHGRSHYYCLATTDIYSGSISLFGRTGLYTQKKTISRLNTQIVPHSNFQKMEPNSAPSSSRASCTMSDSVAPYKPRSNTLKTSSRIDVATSILLSHISHHFIEET
jgi:hypothetical protein